MSIFFTLLSAKDHGELDVPNLKTIYYRISPLIILQTAANCVQLRCQSDGIYGISQCKTSWGDWTEESCSDPGAKICGIRTRTESDQGGWGDDSGLNDIELFCCTGYP